MAEGRSRELEKRRWGSREIDCVRGKRGEWEGGRLVSGVVEGTHMWEGVEDGWVGWKSGIGLRVVRGEIEMWEHGSMGRFGRWCVGIAAGVRAGRNLGRALMSWLACRF